MSFLIEKAGIFTSVQDLGRYGLQGLGINPRGAMDRTAARITNLLLDNDDSFPLLECHFPGPEIVFESTTVFALGGADFAASLDGRPIPNWQIQTARGSSILRFERKIFGNRCYLAIEGGIRKTPVKIQESPLEIAGFVTERLQKGERFFSGRPRAALSNAVTNRCVSRSLLPAYSNFPTVRIIKGGEFDGLVDEDKQRLHQSGFAISQNSNRMGFRLQGPALRLAEPVELVSAAVGFGTIQLLPDGQMIVLMADHQTSGGYPRIGNIISADLPLIAQLGPGDKVSFKLVDIREAERLAAQIEADLRKLKIGASFGRYW